MTLTENGKQKLSNALNTMLYSRNINFSYNGKRYFHYPDIRCTAGETLLVTGKSGSGKTTLMHILGGLLTGYKGEISIGDMQLHSLSPSELDAFRGKNIGIVFQHPHLIKSLIVKDNILIASKNITHISLLQVADILQITPLLFKLPSQLSQGEQQRATIARALINKPRLILADEPTSSLDDENAVAVLNLLQGQAKLLGSALVIVTHDERLKQKVDNQISIV